MHKEKLAANKDIDAMMQQKLFSLALAKPVETEDPSIEKNINGKTFVVEPNAKNIETISFKFKNEKCIASIKTSEGVYEINFGEGEWQYSETTMHGPYLVSAAKGNLTGLPLFKIAGDYDWKNESTLELVLRYIESPHTETITCSFDRNKIQMEIKNSFKTNGVAQSIMVKGEVKE